MKQKLLNYVILLTSMFFISSCDFNITDMPGPQMSSSVKVSKSHGTYICTYIMKGNAINGIKIKEIFAERKFWREEGFLSKKKINCCESQLVIASSQPFSIEGTGYDIDWKVIGFDAIHSYSIYKDFKGIVLPDSIPISVVSKKDEHLLQNLTLYKVK